MVAWSPNEGFHLISSLGIKSSGVKGHKRFGKGGGSHQINCMTSFDVFGCVTVQWICTILNKMRLANLLAHVV